MEDVLVWHAAARNLTTAVIDPILSQGDGAPFDRYGPERYAPEASICHKVLVHASNSGSLETKILKMDTWAKDFLVTCTKRGLVKASQADDEDISTEPFNNYIVMVSIVAAEPISEMDQGSIDDLVDQLSLMSDVSADQIHVAAHPISAELQGHAIHRTRLDAVLHVLDADVAMSTEEELRWPLRNADTASIKLAFPVYETPIIRSAASTDTNGFPLPTSPPPPLSSPLSVASPAVTPAVTPSPPSLPPPVPTEA